MRQLSILILFFFYSNFIVKGQTTNQYSDLTKKFIDSIFSGMHESHKKIILSEIIDTSTFYHIKSILSVDTFYKRVTYNYGKTTKIDTFILSENERKFIDSFYSNYLNLVWTTDLINDAIILSSDTIKEIYRNNAADIDIYLGYHYGDRRLFSFTKPIFLRDNSICIFYDESDCGILCGGGNLAIYQKQDDKWKRYVTLLEWVE